MPRWEVPYESPDRTLTRYVGATVFSMAGFLPLCVLTLGDPSQPLSWIAGLLLGTAFITVAWRVSLIGVWVGARGVKISMVLRTRVVPWADFDRVWLGPATGHDALALWISDRHGAEIETPIWRANSPAAHKNRTRLEQDQLSGLMERLRTQARQEGTWNR
ncbi:hypothetical protein [Actinoplanes sp. NPDC026619]|uniref:hypothetical protein n=1 Tax=Actinoplanes sp. NPDC026619 TaxID=3155798 RepID=UPI003407A073